MKPNPAPAWVNRNLNRYWDQIVKVAPKRGGVAVMPEIASETKRGKMTFEELGCGHYGCVIKSSEPDIVFKLTSDASEAAFVVAACEIGDFPEGIVRYYKIVEIPETHRGRRVFALWREEASAIGFPLRVHGYKEVTDPYIRRQWKELLKNLELFQKHAAIVRDYVKKSKDKARALALIKESEDFAWRFTRDERAMHLAGAKKAAVSLQHCEDIAMTMEHTAESDQIGSTMGFYIEHGILLADVHANNVGVVTRPPDEGFDNWYSVNVITDPGHMVPLKERWLSVSVPKL